MPADGLRLISRRDLRSGNSWLHNVNVLMKGKERCTLLIHPSDADERGLVTGDVAEVESRVGRIAVPVEVTDEMRVGVVCLPWGWGHDAPGARMRVAEGRPGVNSNVLTDGAVLDPVSGNGVLNGIPVTVGRPA
jgi:anaerobic selenocysteine-containing dehydrogenase